jgi:hypothetical protein
MNIATPTNTPATTIDAIFGALLITSSAALEIHRPGDAGDGATADPDNTLVVSGDVHAPTAG